MAQQKSSRNRKILYIDDDLNNSYLMKRILEAEGYHVSLAPNGLMGLAQAERERPDLIMLDIYMPDMNGHQVAHCLRQMEHTKDTPILIVTVSRNSEDRHLSARAGCNGYITKPVDVDLISEQVAAYFN